MTNTPLLSALVIAMLAVAGCQRQDQPAQVYHVRGVIQEFRQDDPTVVIIDHEEIPGYMRAMIMPFRVRKADELKDLEPGQVVSFEYHVSELRSWIEDIKPTGETAAPKTADLTAAPAPPLDPGEVLPDYEFVDENGQDVKLSDFHGKPIAMTFVFTRCPVPEYCPAMMRNFRSVLSELEADPEAPDDFVLLTISFDTANDTPDVMKAWGAAFGHQPGARWKLLSSDSCCVINQLAANVGLKYGEVNGSYQHNLRTVVLDPERRIQRVFTDETWSTGDLASALKSAAKPSVPVETGP